MLFTFLRAERAKRVFDDKVPPSAETFVVCIGFLRASRALNSIILDLVHYHEALVWRKLQFFCVSLVHLTCTCDSTTMLFNTPRRTHNTHNALATVKHTAASECYKCISRIPLCQHGAPLAKARLQQLKLKLRWQLPDNALSPTTSETTKMQL